MASQKQEESAKAETYVTPETVLPAMTMKDLLAVITAATQSANQQNQANLQDFARTLADSIMESRKPLPDPKAEAHRKNEEHFKNQERLQIKQTKENQKRGQDACQHLSGTKGDLPDIYGRTAIAWHMNDVGIEFGICLNCTRLFTPLDADYGDWKRKPSFCRIHSAAGQRTVFNHQEALDKSVLRDS